MNSTRYSIGELAKAAEVTPRTIRFYSAEGLLPPPLSEGRYALYTSTHLVRLQLIQRLKSAFLPLNAIRTHTENLSDEQIRDLLGDKSAMPNAKTAENAPAIRIQATESRTGQSSPEYLAQILAVTGQGAASDPGAGGEGRRKRALLVSPVFQPEPDKAAGTKEQAAMASASAEVWERIRVNARMELHVRAPLTTEERQRIERFVSQAKALFPDGC